MKIYKKIMSIVSLIVVVICLIVFSVFALQLVLELADELGFTDIWLYLICVAFAILYFTTGVIPLTIVYCVWGDEKKEKKDEISEYPTEVYLNNAIRFIDEGKYKGAKDEIKWALRKNNLKIYDEMKGDD